MILQIFNKYLQMGGEEKSVERIRKHAQEAGLEVEKCFFDSADWQGSGAPSQFQQLKKLFYNKDSGLKLEAAITEHTPKALLLHNIYPVGSPAILDVAHKKGVPIIQYVHNFRPFSVGGTLYAKGRYCPESLDGNFSPEILRGAWQGSILKSVMMARVLKNVQNSGWLDNVEAWICISEYMAEAFERAGVSRKKIHVLSHCWDVSEERDDVSDDGYYLFLGRLTEEKGIRVLFDAWAHLAEVLGENVPQLMIGGDGPMSSEVEAMASRVTWLSYSGLVQGEEKSGLIQNSRAMLAPSVWKEPLGLVTFEAQDAMKAIFSARSGGLAETTIHGETGFLHEPGNGMELAEQIISYEKLTPEERKAFGKRAKNRLLKEYSPNTWKQKFTTIIDDVINTK